MGRAADCSNRARRASVHTPAKVYSQLGIRGGATQANCVVAFPGFDYNLILVIRGIFEVDFPGLSPNVLRLKGNG